MRASTPETPKWIVDPRDPRAPPTEIWASMNAEERAAVIAALPSEPAVDAGAPPEGDAHYDAADGPRKTLRRFFDKLGRRAYVGTNLPVYYANEPMFAPDVFVVLDVDPKKRMRWTVDDEGKGLDLVIEVHVAGDWRKDFVENVARYSRLGIGEYFAWNVPRGALVGHRLGPSGAYAALVPGALGIASQVLGLELMVEGDRLRFFNAGAPLPELDELVSRLESAVGSSMIRLQEAERDLEARDATLAARDAALEQAEARIAALEAELAAVRARK
jgi:hypothetical protein